MRANKQPIAAAAAVSTVLLLAVVVLVSTVYETRKVALLGEGQVFDRSVVHDTSHSCQARITISLPSFWLFPELLTCNKVC
jgi:hypothetical protein